ncbi:MAG: hypothetical protein RR413_04550 [Christensenellaceae bacterium]
MQSNAKKGFKNIFFGFSGQLIILALGIVVPRLILVGYGSEINGLVNTTNQIYNYVSLLQAGIGQSAVVALYKIKDRQGISEVVSGTQHQFAIAGVLYLLCEIVTSLSLPFIVKSELPYFTIASMTFVSGLPNLISYFVASAYIEVLTVDGKQYVISNITLITTIMSSITKIVLANMQVDIILLQAITCFVGCLKSLFVYIYFKRNYPWVKKTKTYDKSVFVDRAGYIKTQIAWIVFSNTDVLLISCLLDLKAASVYSVYNLVFSAIYTLMNQVYISVGFLLGHEYNKSIELYTKLHDAFDCFFDMLICSTMAIAYAVIIPFIKLYTSGISDVVYVNKLYPILFCGVAILTWSRYAAGNLTSLAGYAKKIGNISMIEAGINVLLSLMLIKVFGIAGALLATVVALLYKSNYLITFVNRKVLKRSPLKTYRILVPNVVLFMILVGMFEYIICISISNYIEFMLKGIICSAIIYPLFFVFNYLFNKNEIVYIFNAMRKAKE